MRFSILEAGESELGALPGTYALLMRATPPLGTSIQVGRLGLFPLEAGTCVYVGSAFGPGGLRARIRHHQRMARSPHWHIDYLRQAIPLEDVWYSDATERLECRWAESLVAAPGARIPLAGFGASDCGCVSHLFHFRSLPNVLRGHLLARGASGNRASQG